MVYVVCQTGSCQQTYPLEYFGVITRDTKNINCEECGGVLIDEKGRGNFSQNSTVIQVVKAEEVRKQQEMDLVEKRKKMDKLEKQIKQLEEELVE